MVYSIHLQWFWGWLIMEFTTWMEILHFCDARICQWEALATAAGSYDTSRPGWMKCSDRAKEPSDESLYGMEETDGFLAHENEDMSDMTNPKNGSALTLTYGSGWWVHGSWLGGRGFSMWLGWWNHLTSIANVLFVWVEISNQMKVWKQPHPPNTKHSLGGCKSGKMKQLPLSRWEYCCTATGMTRTYKNVY